MIVIPAIEDVVVVMGVVVTAVEVVTVVVGKVVVGVVNITDLPGVVGIIIVFGDVGTLNLIVVRVGCLKIFVCECVSFSGLLKLSSPDDDDDELLFCDLKKSGCSGM